MPRRPNVCPHWADGNCKYFGIDHFSCKYQEHPLKYLYSNICHRELRHSSCPENCRRIHALRRDTPSHIVRMCREWDTALMQPPIYRHIPSLPEWLTQRGDHQEHDGTSMRADTETDEYPDPAEVLEMLRWWKTYVKGDTAAPAPSRAIAIKDEEERADNTATPTNRPRPSCAPTTSTHVDS